jgi:hypothetical protein
MTQAIDRYPCPNEPTWSKSEKEPEILFAAEIAFRGLDRCMPEAATELRNMPSPFTQVFAKLLHERRLSEQELRRLREDKMKLIHSFAEFLARDVA